MAELKTLKRQRGNIQGSITTFKTMLDEYEATDPTERDHYILQAALDGLRGRWSKFPDIQDEIEELDKTEIAKRIPLEQSFDHIIGRAMRLLSSTSTSSTPHPMQAPVLVKLPRIDIPKFDGLIENWSSFFDLFSCLVDQNADLSPVQKLQYLRSSVTGKAAVAIESLATTDKNYNSAIEILKKKFDCTQKALRRHWSMIYDYPRLQKDTSAALGDLVDTVNQHVRALKNLGQPTESWDLPLIHMILTKISFDRAWQWKLTIPDARLPTYMNLLEFLEKRASCSASSTSHDAHNTRIQNHQNSRQHKGQSRGQLFVTTNAPLCAICGETNHIISRCQKFRAMTVAERQNAMKEAALCFNCLRPDHRVAQCTSRDCLLCNGRHNTLLHKSGSSEDVKNGETTSNQS